jgi:hypothetical protein
VRLHDHGLSVADIRRSTGLSERLIGDYLALYQATDPDNEQLRQLLSEPDAATERPAEIKRGAWLP